MTRPVPALAVAFSHPDINVIAPQATAATGDRRVHFRHGADVVEFPTVTTTPPALISDMQPARRSAPARRRAS